MKSRKSNIKSLQKNATLSGLFNIEICKIRHQNRVKQICYHQVKKAISLHIHLKPEN